MPFISSKSHLLYWIVIFLMPVCVTAQQICGELPLYFEDAIGNRDTIFLVYGEGFNVDSVYRELEEDSLSFQSSFDNDLTVYFSKGYYDSTTPFFSKKGVFGTPDCSREMPPPFPFFVKCKHPPLKISWNIEKYCRITETNLQTLFWFFNTIYFAFVDNLIEYYDLKTAVVCEDDPDDIIEPLGFYTPQGWQYTIHKEQVNEDGSIDSIYMLYGVFSMWLVSSLAPEKTPTKLTQIFPNPGTGNVLHIESANSSSVQIILYDISGKVVLQQTNFHLDIGMNDLDVNQDLIPGNYLLAIRYQNGTTDWHKVVRN
jgi:hypothetical protein